MFDRISDSFSGALRKLSGSGTISEANVREAMDGVRNALLEADVQYAIPTPNSRRRPPAS